MKLIIVVSKKESCKLCSSMKRLVTTLSRMEVKVKLDNGRKEVGKNCRVCTYNL